MEDLIRGVSKQHYGKKAGAENKDKPTSPLTPEALSC